MKQIAFAALAAGAALAGISALPSAAHAANGCGRDFHIAPNGQCEPNRGAYQRDMRERGYGSFPNGSRDCGRDFHVAPNGRCEPNRGAWARDHPRQAAEQWRAGQYYNGRGWWDGNRWWKNRTRDHDRWTYRD